MNPSNIKDTLTTIAGILGAIGFVGATIVATLIQSGVVVPPIVTIIVGVCVATSTGILGYFNGKNPDGTKKTEGQVIQQNKEAAETRP